MSACTAGSEYLRPIKRLASAVFFGFIAVYIAVKSHTSQSLIPYSPIFFFLLSETNCGHTSTNHNSRMSPITYLVLRRVPMRRSLSVKATYDGVVRLPMSLAMISTLRERKKAYQNSSLVSPRHPRRRPSRASSSPSSRFPRSVAMRSRAVAAEKPRASPPRPSTPRRPTERTKNTQKNTLIARSLARARVASPPTTARPSSLSPPFASSRIIDRHRGEENAPVHPSRAHSNAPIVLPTPTHEYVVPRSIPIAGPSACR